jgi:hypothetical protein
MSAPPSTAMVDPDTDRAADADPTSVDTKTATAAGS